MLAWAEACPTETSCETQETHCCSACNTVACAGIVSRGCLLGKLSAISCQLMPELVRFPRQNQVRTILLNAMCDFLLTPNLLLRYSTSGSPHRDFTLLPRRPSSHTLLLRRPPAYAIQ